jgi:hypothetical protein
MLSKIRVTAVIFADRWDVSLPKGDSGKLSDYASALHSRVLHVASSDDGETERRGVAQRGTMH